ncbi:alpha/beta hydrolase [Halorientalis litorea]|uniref:alpha/beta hydrolase n=1 Tax=Halorientalis litorea TaxID=2931977 RepID=UPI001FF1FB35|nr:alpha/beta hydrolase [Halorientalis litorea]
MADEPHPHAQNLLNIIDSQPIPPVYALSVADAREQFENVATLRDAPDVADVRNFEIQGPEGPLPVRTYYPEGEGPHPTLVYFHGGGFVLGNIETHDALCRELANAGECAVLSVDYRLAPEHSFPAPVYDAYAAVEWIAENGAHVDLDSDRIAVGGDSAGGNLTAATTLMGQDRDGPDIQHQLLLYPALASPAVHDFDSYEENAEGYFLETPGMEWFLDCYVDDDLHLRNEYFSPLLANDLSDTPPASVVTAGFDPLRDEGQAYAERLAEDDVPVDHYHYEDMIHGFVSMSDMIDAGADAVEKIGADLQDAFAE